MSAKSVQQPVKSDTSRDARCYPRFRAQVPTRLTTPTGEELAASTRLISMVGLEVNCDQLAMLQVMTKNSEKPAGERRILHFSVDLPTDPSATISGTAALVNSRRLSQNHYVLAIHFLKLSEADLEQLAEFLGDCTLA